MKRVGITGEKGFIGTHLYNTIGLYPANYTRINFKKEYFKSTQQLDQFVSNCDVIVHLAGVNRHNDAQTVYNTNINLTQLLVDALERTGAKAQLIFSSSLQEEKDNLYGQSKKVSRMLLADWAKRNGRQFAGMIIPNVFGPFGNPYYNSVVATFCHQLVHSETPQIEVDGELKLIYIEDLVKEIISIINEEISESEYLVVHTDTVRVSEILKLLISFKETYMKHGVIPLLHNKFELNMFNTFRCYEDIRKKYPVKFKQATDTRGSFTEIIRLNIGGQVSFSNTHPGITRGNHFHTRKIERFAVISGEALIQLRRIGTNEVMNFHLSGNEPAFVDMPIWYTHNIKNIGKTELYTIFWINEFYDESDPDTFFEEV